MTNATRIASALVVLALASSTARADTNEDPAFFHPEEPTRMHGLFDVPVILGGEFDSKETHGVGAIRPEFSAAFQKDGDESAYGIGVYGLIGKASETTEYGAGGTLIYMSGYLGFAPSVGVIRRGDKNGLNGSLFVGLRTAELHPFDLATGVRFDLQHIDGVNTFSLSLQLDLALPVIGAWIVSELLSIKH